MSEKQNQKPATPGISAFSTLDPKFWKPYADYNNLDASKRGEALKGLGITETDPTILGILTKSHFVIPGTTRFECQQCGECCRYARKVATLTYEPCLFLTPENTCSKHDKRYMVCKWFPFWMYNSPVAGPLLTIKPYCTGYGKGPLVEYLPTLKRMASLASEEAIDSDGAFVIHQVLMIPGRKDWVFPSKTNIDALMVHLQEEITSTSTEEPAQRPLERPGEINYAHHYMSGLLGNINDPLLTIGENGWITDINDSACLLIQQESRSLIGKPLTSLFVNPERVSACVSSCFTHGKETASAQRLLLPGNSPLPVLLNAMVYRDKIDGLVHGALVCIVPVSASVFSEVSQAKDYARGLLEASLDALMVIDRDGTLSDVNEMVVTLTGLARNKLLGQPFKDLFVDKEKALQGVNTTFANGLVRNFELSFSCLGGNPVPVSFNATVYRNSDGVVQGIFAAARDIRERLAMVHELEEAKNYARGLIECSIDLMVTIDPNGIITDANNAASLITGRPHAEIVGAPFMSFFDDPKKATQGVKKTFAEGSVKNYEMNLLVASKTCVPVSFNATLYRNSAGVVQGIFAIARAMT